MQDIESDQRQPLLNDKDATYQATNGQHHGHSHGEAGHSHGHGHSHGNEAEDEHKDVGDGGLRAVVFGFSDGLVTNLCLILGVYSAGQEQHSVIIATGIAGILAGAASMAIGEWISMKIQSEASEAQLHLERSHLTKYPEDEAAHFHAILADNGLTEEAIKLVLRDVRNCPMEQQVKWHGLMELKIDPEELGGSPMKAALASFCGFTIGALIPLLPWICTTHSTTAFVVTVALSGICVTLLGLGLAMNLGLEKDRWAWVTVRQLVVVVIATAVVIGANTGIGELIARAAK